MQPANPWSARAPGGRALPEAGREKRDAVRGGYQRDAVAAHRSRNAGGVISRFQCESPRILRGSSAAASPWPAPSALRPG